MLRNTALGLRFPLLVYVNVHSRREIRACLVLLASCFVLRELQRFALHEWNASVRELLTCVRVNCQRAVGVKA